MSMLAAAGGLVGCAGMMTLLLVLRIGVSVALPWWVAVLVPAIVYAVIAAVSLAGISLGRKGLGLAGLLGTHALAVLVGAIASVGVSGLTLEEAVLEAGARFLPAPLLLLCAVPLALMPLRPLLERGQRSHGHRASSQRVEPSWPGGRSEAVPGWYAWPREEFAPAEATGVESGRATTPSLPAAEQAPTVSPMAPSQAEAAATPQAPLAFAASPPVGLGATAPLFTDPSPTRPGPPASEMTRVPVSTSAELPPWVAMKAVPTEPSPSATSTEAAGDVAMDLAPRQPEPPAEPTWSPVASESHAWESPSGAPAPRDMITIPFEHIAAQLPAAAFSVPLERLGASLLEPGCLLVPRDIILPQLAEGEVTAAWEDVADQFPAQALAVARHAVAAQLPHGRLVLPLAEVFAQLPPDVFALSSAEVDVSGIQGFSLPFQPEPPSLVEPVPVASAPAASPVERTESPIVVTLSSDQTAVTVSEGPAAVPLAERPSAATTVDGPVPVAEQPAPASPPGEEPRTALAESVAEDVTGEPSVSAPAPSAEQPARAGSAVEPWAAARALTEEAAKEPAPLPERHQERSESAPEALTSAPPERSGPSPTEAVRAHRDADRRTMRLLAERLAPVGALEADVLNVDGVQVHTFLAPAIPIETVMTLATQVLGLLEPGLAPWPVDQFTLRLEEGAVVLTPLPATEGVRSVVVAAIRRGGSLAMLEILSRQAAAERPVAPNGRPVTPVSVLADGDITLRQISAGPAQHQVASMLGGLGRLVPTVFRGAEDGLELSLFLDGDDDAPAVGRYGHRLCRALSSDGVPRGLGPLRSVVVRTGERRLALMPTEGAPGRWTALLTATGPARPGLVRLHTERAAARLAAS